MAAYFFDSSAIVKRYINETGSAWVLGITDPATDSRVYVASVTGVEVVSAITRKVRGGHVAPLNAAVSLSDFHQDFAAEYRVTAISDSVINRAMAVAETYALRGYDAIQLAAAVETNSRRVALGAPPLILVAADRDLLAAGVAEGLLTDNPDEH